MWQVFTQYSVPHTHIHYIHKSLRLVVGFQRGEILMFQNIIDQLKEFEKEMADLRREKAQAEGFLALVMSKVGEVDISFNELFKADPTKVQVQFDSNDKDKAKLVYMIESNDSENDDTKKEG